MHTVGTRVIHKIKFNVRHISKNIKDHTTTIRWGCADSYNFAWLVTGLNFWFWQDLLWKSSWAPCVFSGGIPERNPFGPCFFSGGISERNPFRSYEGHGRGGWPGLSQGREGWLGWSHGREGWPGISNGKNGYSVSLEQKSPKSFKKSQISWLLSEIWDF